MDPRPGSAVIPAAQEHPFAVKETAKVEMASVFEEVAPHDAAMSEIRAVVAVAVGAPNPVVAVELAAINIALTVIEVASMPQIVAIKPPILPALVASNVAVPVLLIVERATLRPLSEVRPSCRARRHVRGAGRAARHAAEVRGAGRAVRHHRRATA